MLSKNVPFKIYTNIILLVVLYGCETWSLTLTELHRMRRYVVSQLVEAVCYKPQGRRFDS